MNITQHNVSTREPPGLPLGSRAGPGNLLVKPPPWRPPRHMQTFDKKPKNKPSEITENTMKKDRKQQEDRLLKHLNLRERQRQVMLRKQIASDPMFLVV